MKIRERQQELTRRAILDALADVIVESGATGYAVQEVADRAGVTHRTVYNHYPTREALNDALAERVEEEIVTIGGRPDENMSLAGMAPMWDEAFRAFEQRAPHVRAYVMLMIASRAPAKVARDRTAAIEQVIERDAGPLPPGTARLVTAVVRTFGSSIGWHLLTEQMGLSTDEAVRSATWATETLLAAVARGDLPRTETNGEADDDE